MRLTYVLIPLVLLLHRTAVSQTVFVTADTEGHTEQCQTCPMHVGHGGMARRATAIAQARAAGDLLLLDAGNFLFGAESADSKGKVIVAAYDALAYDAANLSYRDFRLGKAQTLELLKDAKFAAVSANLLDDATGQPLVKPYIVKKLGGKRIAVLGVCEAPPGMQYLPALKQQLAGIRVRAIDEALAEWLPKAKAEADQVVVLYYGSARGLSQMKDKWQADIWAIGVGGVNAELPANSAGPAIVVAEEHGKSLGRLALAAGSHPDQLDISPTIDADPKMLALVASYVAKPVAAATPATLPMVAMSQPAVTEPAVALTQPATLPVALVPPPVPATMAAAPPVVPVVQAPPVVTPEPARPPARVAAHQPLTPKGLAGVGLTETQVNAAIDRGARFLWEYVKAQDVVKQRSPFGSMREHALVALALVHSGAQTKFPDFEAQLRRYLTEAQDFQTQGAYGCGLLSMLIESYGDPVFYSKQRQAARYLVEAQGTGGSWTYNISLADSFGQPDVEHQPLRVIAPDAPDPTEKGMTRISDWSLGKDGDNSCSQFALLGIHSASRCNTKIGADVWRRNLAACRQRQCADGGWAYNGSNELPYGSMTCAGLCALAINRYELGEKQPEVDEGIERGLAWLAANFSVDKNPKNEGNYLYYYLYSLERVGRILDTEFIGNYEWYPQGARFLVGAQKSDGSWMEPADTDPRCTTAFALLFLTRATPKLAMEVKRGGTGTLKTDIETPPPPRLYFILDASGSMMTNMGGKLKFDVARQATQSLIDRLPDKSQVALRVYGHRKRALDEGADEDTALEIPMGPLDRAAFAAKLQSLRARGKTPLALSLTQALSDLSGTSPNNGVMIVLLTDGGEDTFPRRNPVKAAAEFAKLKGATLHIVGFDINQADWGEQLRAMAKAAGGYYIATSKPETLGDSIMASVFGRPDGFTVLDASGKEAARGPFGQQIVLPEGKYRLSTSFGGSDFNAPVSIATGATTVVLFDASKIQHK
ncbi:MAG TPA: VWA domain-containing protein [Humisphaera sp.]|nr:VWA domain-containing protein [Humisphaera sp.]